jgi:hypothetical protein
MENKAALELLPRKEFRLTLSDGTVCNGQFGTWALARFLQKKKLPLSAAGTLFGDELQVMDLIDYVVCAVEYKEQLERRQPVMNAITLSKWIDDYNDATGEIGVLITLALHEKGEAEQKKSPLPQPENQQNGAISKETSLPLVEA